MVPAGPFMYQAIPLCHHQIAGCYEGSNSSTLFKFMDGKHACLYVNKNNGWNSRYACALITVTLIPASTERFLKDDNLPLSDARLHI